MSKSGVIQEDAYECSGEEVVVREDEELQRFREAVFRWQVKASNPDFLGSGAPVLTDTPRNDETAETPSNLVLLPLARASKALTQAKYSFLVSIPAI